MVLLQKTTFLFCLFFGLAGLAAAQNYTGKGVIWELNKPNEPRLKLKFGTSGINIGGYEGTTLMFENLTNFGLYVETRLTITDFCGTTRVRQVKVTVKANSKLGGSTWMGGDEQYDFNTTCKDRKTYAPTMVTKIADVALEIISVKEINGAGSGSSTGNTTTQPLPAAKPKPAGSTCNADMPQIVLSEQGQHYLKLADGSFVKINPDQYARFKQINSPEEKRRFIQSCTGNPRDTIRLQARPFNPGN